MNSPLLMTPASDDADATVTDAEVAALVSMARDRRARSVVIGSGRTPGALATARLIAAAWERAGGDVLDTITWPETGASWLRFATRFAAADPDLWVMTGPATGWAQMTRRLLWSTAWRPARTLATAVVGDPRTLALVGPARLYGLAGASADGTTWHVGEER
ncbi:hypothetical protein ACWEPC_06760 [Nonomuraea sp. NPDC004297]